MTSKEAERGTWQADDRELLIGEVGETHAAVLLERSTACGLANGQVLLRDGGPVEALYLILEGRLSLSVELDTHTIRIGDLEPGNWVGMEALFDTGGQSANTVSAAEDCRLMRLSFNDFTALMSDAPETACYLTHVLVPMLIHRLRVLVNDPILDPAGQLMMPGEMSLPRDARPHHEHGLAHFFKHLWGSD